MFTTGGRRGACAFFFFLQSPRNKSANRFFPSRSLYLYLPLFPFFASSLPRGQIAISLAGLSSDRTAIKLCFDVSAPIFPRVLLQLACVYLHLCESRRCKLVNASTAVWCSSRLMSSRRVHASVTLTASGTAVSASPMSLPSLLSFSFNRLLRIFFLDRMDIALRRTCIYALLSPHDRISQLR